MVFVANLAESLSHFLPTSPAFVRSYSSPLGSKVASCPGPPNLLPVSPCLPAAGLSQPFIHSSRQVPKLCSNDLLISCLPLRLRAQWDQGLGLIYSSFYGHSQPIALCNRCSVNIAGPVLGSICHHLVYSAFLRLSLDFCGSF